MEVYRHQEAAVAKRNQATNRKKQKSKTLQIQIVK